MVKHGCEKKRDGKGQFGEEMLGKGREGKRYAEKSRGLQSKGTAKRGAVRQRKCVEFR